MDTLQNSHSLLYLLLGDTHTDTGDGENASKEQAEFSRISGKVDRAFERLRRSVSGLVESSATASGVEQDDVVEVLLHCVKALQGLLDLALNVSSSPYPRIETVLILHNTSRGRIVTSRKAKTSLSTSFQGP